MRAGRWGLQVEICGIEAKLSADLANSLPFVFVEGAVGRFLLVLGKLVDLIAEGPN